MSKKQGLKKIYVRSFHNQLLIKTACDMTVLPRMSESMGTVFWVEQKPVSQGCPRTKHGFLGWDAALGGSVLLLLLSRRLNGVTVFG